MIKLRPFLWLSIVTIPAFAVLVMLGTWQLQRLQWKNDLISSFEARSHAPAIAPPAVEALTADLEFRRLVLTGVFAHDKELYMTGKTYEGNAGFHVMTPMLLTDGRIIMVNRGWVSEDYRDPAKREFSLVTGEVTVDAILRMPGKKGYFVPENEPENGFWFTTKPAQMLPHLGFADNGITAFYADSLRTSDVVTLPIAAKTELNLRNAHLSYAMTWYGIALGLLAVYLAFHHQAGRLTFKSASAKQDDGEA
jgi:surfeit locus 1 family protein